MECGIRDHPHGRYKKSPRTVCAGILLCVIKIYVPNNRQDNSNEKEEQSRYKNTAVISLLGLAELTRAVIRISLVLGSAHRDKGEYDISENKSDAYECPLATDVQHACKKRHQYARNEESIG